MKICRLSSSRLAVASIAFLFATTTMAQQTSPATTSLPKTSWVLQLLEAQRPAVEKVLGKAFKDSPAGGHYRREGFDEIVVEYADNAYTKPWCYCVSVTFPKDPLGWKEALQKVGIDPESVTATEEEWTDYDRDRTIRKRFILKGVAGLPNSKWKWVVSFIPGHSRVARNGESHTVRTTLRFATHEMK